MNVDFETFQDTCRYCQWGFDEMTGTYDLTCRKVIPDGESWGICDETHCPYYGTKASNSTESSPKGMTIVSHGGVRVVFEKMKGD